MRQVSLSLLVGLVFSCSLASAACVEKFSWLPNTEADLGGYKIHYGVASGGPYTGTVDVGLPSPVNGRILGEVATLVCGETYYFVCTAYNAQGTESDYSTESGGVTATTAGLTSPGGVHLR